MPSEPAPRLEGGEFFADVVFCRSRGGGGGSHGQEFQRCTFRRFKLPERRRSWVKLEDCMFTDCDLTRMVPRELAPRTGSDRDRGAAHLLACSPGVGWRGQPPPPRRQADATLTMPPRSRGPGDPP